MKRTKKILKVIGLVLILTTLLSITAFAGNQGVTVEGINKYPCFTVNNQFVYCAEIQAKVPETGMIYNQTADDTNFSCCDKIFIATKIMSDDSVEYRQIIQQMIWGAINGFKPDASIRKISDTAYAKYQEILTVIENINDEYTVTYFSYETNEVPASGGTYQKLIGAEVKKVEKPVMMAPAPVIPDPEPETTEKTPPSVEETTKDLVEETTEDPVEETTEETTTEEQTTLPPVEEIKKVPLNEEAPEFEIPNTGARGTTVIGIVVFMISMIAIVVIAKGKKEKTTK